MRLGETRAYGKHREHHQAEEHPAVDEVVGPGGGVLVPPGDDESVATGLAAAVALAADLDRTQVARWARRVHDLESSITRYEQFFARVLAGAA